MLVEIHNTGPVEPKFILVNGTSELLNEYRPPDATYIKRLNLNLNPAMFIKIEVNFKYWQIIQPGFTDRKEFTYLCYSP